MMRLNALMKMVLTPRSKHIAHLQKIQNVRDNSHAVSIRSVKLFARKRCGPQILLRRGVHEFSDTDSEDNVDPLGMYAPDSSESWRQRLYPDSSDETILKLNRCASMQDVYQVVGKDGDKLNHTHVCQMVLVMWDIQRMVEAPMKGNKTSNDITDFASQLEYDTGVLAHPDFAAVMELVLRHHENFNPDEACCTLLHLCKMGIPMENEIFQALVSHCERMMKELGNEFPLTALSKFAVANNKEQGVRKLYTALDILPLVIDKLYRCSTAEDFRLIAICFNNMTGIISRPILDAFTTKLQELLNSKVITSSDPKVILKIIFFLNHPRWRLLYPDLITELMKKLENKVSSLEPQELVSLYKILEYRLEPAGLLNEIQSVAMEILSQGFKPLRTGTYITSVADLVMHTIPTFFHPQRKPLVDLVKIHLNSPSCEVPFHALYKVLSHLESPNLWDFFWAKYLSHLNNNVEERDDSDLPRACRRYMKNSNRLQGTYRHYDFERHIIQWLIDEIQTKPAGVIPAKFSAMAAFLIAYFNTVKSNVLPDIINKLKDMSSQFNEFDCLDLSMGVQIARDLRLGKQTSISQAQLMEIDHVLDSCAWRHLENEALNIIDLNKIMQSFSCRKGHKDSDLFRKIVTRYEQLDSKISSRVIINVTYNMTPTHYVLKNTMEQIASYIIQNKDHMLGSTTQRVLYLCYKSGYTPENAEELLAVTEESVLRDRERMSGHTIIQASLALCYYHRLSNDLISYIFAQGFLQRLDKEIRHRSYYPKARSLMMQLNRAVCLDYPEADVPWFHTKYCERIVAQAVTRTSPMHEDVYETLKFITGGDKLVKIGTFTPYLYRIDFLVESDQNINPNDQRRVAIMLMRNDAYSNDGKYMKGPHQLKIRHLEILGYHVIALNIRLWNSMFMSERSAKIQYLVERMECK